MLPQIPKPALLKGVGMSPGAGPAAGGNGYSRGGSVEFEGPSGYASGGGGGMPEAGASQYNMGGESRPWKVLLGPPAGSACWWGSLTAAGQSAADDAAARWPLCGCCSSRIR